MQLDVEDETSWDEWQDRAREIIQAAREDDHTPVDVVASLLKSLSGAAE